MSAKSRIASHFAALRAPAIGGAGIDPRREGEAMASHYLFARRVRRMSPAKALAFARELPAAYVSGCEYYEPFAPCGAASREGAETVRHCADVNAIGLRFVGTAESLASLRHNGWYNEPEGDGGTLSGAVWLLPARKGVSRLIYGYRELEASGAEMNPGSALLRVSDVVAAPIRGKWESIEDAPETRDAAIWADGMAERAAEDERDYRESYNRGAKAAEADAEALETAAALRPLLAELRSIRRGAVAGTVPAICAALRSRVDSMLETIRTKREERDSAWADCPSYAEEPWRAGFMDTAAGGFVRAVRLGYAKASDWRGAPEANPMNAPA